MIESQLQRELDSVAARLHQLRLWRGLAAVFLTCTLIGGCVLWLHHFRYAWILVRRSLMRFSEDYQNFTRTMLNIYHNSKAIWLVILVRCSPRKPRALEMGTYRCATQCV